ncbi:MAG: hypothetical protein QOC62_4623 [Mycobacterium sp.]|jgi:hypothetical protein|nr:hypothetical protein [Mycobacterium sp.]
MSTPDATPTPKPKGSRLPNPRRLPAELRRARARGAVVAAHQPGFWGFGPPKPGEGPKPIRYQRPPRGEAAHHEPPNDEAPDGPEAHY